MLFFIYIFFFLILHLSLIYRSLNFIHCFENTLLNDICHFICDFSEDFRFIFYLVNIPVILYLLFLYDIHNQFDDLTKSKIKLFKPLSWRDEWFMHYKFLLNIIFLDKLNLIRLFSFLIYFTLFLPFRVFLYNPLFVSLPRTSTFFISLLLFSFIFFRHLEFISFKSFLLFFFLYLFVDGVFYGYFILSFFYSYSSFIRYYLTELFLKKEFEEFFTSHFPDKLVNLSKFYVFGSLFFDFYFSFLFYGLRLDYITCKPRLARALINEIDFRIDNNLPVPHSQIEWDSLNEAFAIHYVSTAEKLLEFMEFLFKLFVVG
jgi:hypothetical protein